MSKPKVGFYAPEDDVRRARGAFIATMSLPGHPRTFSDFITQALMAEVTRLEEAHNDGHPFPPASTEDTPRGRPLVG